MLKKTDSVEKKRNVAVIVQNGDGGGAERMAANMTLGLEKYCNVFFVLFDGSNIIYDHAGKVIDLKIPPLREAGAFKRIANICKRVKALRDIKKKYDIDAAISHLDGADLVNILSGRGRKGKKCRIISVYHSVPSVNESCSLPHRLFHRFIGAFSDRYIMVSKPAAGDMAENFGVNANKISVIYNFSDLKRIERLKDASLPEEADKFYADHKKMIMNAGRMEKVKRQERLVKILRSLRSEKGMTDTGLVILGDGPERANLTRLVKKYSLEEHVFMPGNVDNPFMYMSRSDVYVLCSDYEGLPMALTEAAACSCPAVSCDMRSGAREILAPKTEWSKHTDSIEIAEYGILTKPFDYPGGENFTPDDGDSAQSFLTDAVGRMLTDEELRKGYIAKSHECAYRFSPERILKKWMKLIAE
ncbi:MAG: glycosyltransferase [Lachnospiraceae bacterium]|nr:glycosyltransferase [Lachnospiraceae bacterium]